MSIASSSVYPEDVFCVTAAFQSFSKCFQDEHDVKQQNLRHPNIY